MIRRWLGDIVFFVMALAAAFLLAGLPQEAQVTPRTIPAPSTAKAPETKAPENGEITEGTAIGERDIFSSSGNYKEGAQAPMPDNPYTLLGVVREGESTKAVFREYTGTVVRAAMGQRMMDGFLVASVDKPVVVLKKGKERKAFPVYGAALNPGAVQTAVKNTADQKPLLVGILKGTEPKAVFRDQSGNLNVLGTRRALPDGSVITRIDADSVRLKKGKENKVLVLYAEVFLKAPVPPQRSAAGHKAAKAQAAERKSNGPDRKAGERSPGSRL